MWLHSVCLIGFVLVTIIYNIDFFLSEVVFFVVIPEQNNIILVNVCYLMMVLLFSAGIVGASEAAVTASGSVCLQLAGAPAADQENQAEGPARGELCQQQSQDQNTRSVLHGGFHRLCLKGDIQLYCSLV